MIWGQHGIAKSSIIAQIGKELGKQVFSIMLSQKEPVDVVGVLYTYTNHSLGMSVTAAHPPDWFAEALKKGDVILFLDEYNMARREVMGASFELVNDRRLNNMVLPDTVFVVCAGNPNDDRYDVTPMSESLVTRLMHIQVHQDAQTWLQWALTPNSGIHPDVIEYIRNNPKALFVADERDKTFPVEIKYCARSWERAGIVHNLPLPIHLKQECIRGLIGLEHSIAFVKAHGHANNPLDAMDILEMKPETVARVKEMLNPKKMRIDLLNLSADNLVDFAVRNVALASTRMNNIMRFIKMLPMDCAQTAILKLLELPGWGEHFENDAEILNRIETINQAMNLSKAG